MSRQLTAALLCTSAALAACEPATEQPLGELWLYTYPSRTQSCGATPSIQMAVEQLGHSARVLIDGHEVEHTVTDFDVCRQEYVSFSGFRPVYCSYVRVDLPLDLPLGLHDVEVVREDGASRRFSHGYYHTDRGFFPCPNRQWWTIPRQELDRVRPWGASMVVTDLDRDGDDDAFLSFEHWKSESFSQWILLQDQSQDPTLRAVELADPFVNHDWDNYIITDIRDADLDGCPDLIAMALGNLEIFPLEREDPEVVYARSRCDGTYERHVQIEAGVDRNAALLVDLVGSARRDAVLWHRRSGELAVYEHTRRGFWPEPEIWSSDMDFSRAKAVDLDGDGREEVIGWFFDCLGIAVGRFSEGVLQLAYADGPYCFDYSDNMVSHGDIDGDGYIDIVQGRSEPGLGSTESFYGDTAIYWGGPGLTFEKSFIRSRQRDSRYIDGVSIGDFTGDGVLDVYADGVFEQVAPRRFVDRVRELGADCGVQDTYGDACWVIDLDGDGNNDIVSDWKTYLFTILPWSPSLR